MLPRRKRHILGTPVRHKPRYSRARTIHMTHTGHSEETHDQIQPHTHHTHDTHIMQHTREQHSHGVAGVALSRRQRGCGGGARSPRSLYVPGSRAWQAWHFLHTAGGP
eukprot:9065652-Pyramimonas_sp.AAC.1